MRCERIQEETRIRNKYIHKSNRSYNDMMMLSNHPEVYLALPEFTLKCFLINNRKFGTYLCQFEEKLSKILNTESRGKGLFLQNLSLYQFPFSLHSISFHFLLVLGLTTTEYLAIASSKSESNLSPSISL